LENRENCLSSPGKLAQTCFLTLKMVFTLILYSRKLHQKKDVAKIAGGLQERHWYCLNCASVDIASFMAFMMNVCENWLMPVENRKLGC
jgi:hypothetical protein